MGVESVPGQATWTSEGTSRVRGTERPSDLVAQAHWQPERTKVNPEGHSLVGKEKPGGDLKFMAEESTKRINCRSGTVS